MAEKNNAPSKAGRPTKLDKILIDRIANLIQAGNRIETAYLANGVDRGTFSLWCTMGGKRPKSIYGQLLDKMQIAISISDIRDLDIIDRASQRGDWKAAAWRLERRNAKHFGVKQVVQLTGAEGGPIQSTQVDAAKLDEELKRLREANESCGD